jgi:serine/threonine-protein kinase RsbW
MMDPDPSRDETDAMSDVLQNGTIELLIPSDPGESRRIQDDIERRLRQHDYGERDIFSIKLALEEALINAIKHGNQLDRNKKVRVAFCVTSDRFDVTIADEGPGFDPADVPDPTAVENLERPSGRGLMLMRHYMNDVCYNSAGNAVSMSKLRFGR